MAFAQNDIELTPQPPENLAGRWFKNCEGGSVKIEDFTPSEVTLNEIFFLDSKCTRPSLVFVSEGPYIIPAKGIIDFQFSSVRIRLMSEIAVNDFNTRKVCGFSDWKWSEDKEISGRPCEIFFVGLPQRVPAAGEMRYGIYLLEGNRLSLGKMTREQNATSPEKRPTELQPRAYTKMPRIRP